MNKPTFVMAKICLNFSYSQLKEEPDYVPDLKIKRTKRGRTMIAVSCTVEQLFAKAYGAGTPISEEHTIIYVTEPVKLQEIICYKLFVPKQQTANFYTIMQQKLNMEFPDYKITTESIDNKKYMIITDRR